MRFSWDGWSWRFWIAPVWKRRLFWPVCRDRLAPAWSGTACTLIQRQSPCVCSVKGLSAGMGSEAKGNNRSPGLRQRIPPVVDLPCSCRKIRAGAWAGKAGMNQRRDARTLDPASYHHLSLWRWRPIEKVEDTGSDRLPGPEEIKNTVRHSRTPGAGQRAARSEGRALPALSDLRSSRAGICVPRRSPDRPSWGDLPGEPGFRPAVAFPVPAVRCLSAPLRSLPGPPRPVPCPVCGRALGGAGSAAFHGLSLPPSRRFGSFSFRHEKGFLTRPWTNLSEYIKKSRIHKECKGNMPVRKRED